MSDALEMLAPLKVNLFLEVLARRADGYHDLFTVMEALDIGDVVRVEPASDLSVVADRPDVPDGEENLAARIVREAERRLGHPLPARISIKKLAPPQTGLGAGSSDAVTALRGVLRLHGLPEDEEFLCSVAAAVGSDTAFFVRGGTACCTGRGEVVGDPVVAGTRHYAIVWGGPPAPTPEVYRAVDLASPRRDGARFLEDLRGGVAEPFNRLEEAAFRCFPELQELARAIERCLGRTPGLSGSGSAFFVVFASRPEAEAAATRLAAEAGLMAHAARTGVQ
jgi:4-diphosphocytidyl-2-C-methyl-D-erythritol kinase